MNDTSPRFLWGIVFAVTIIFGFALTTCDPKIAKVKRNRLTRQVEDVGEGFIDQRPLLIATYLLIAIPLAGWAIAIRDRSYGGVLHLTGPARLGGTLRGKLETAVYKRPTSDVAVKIKVTKQATNELREVIGEVALSVPASQLETAADGSVVIPIVATLPAARVDPSEAVSIRIAARAGWKALASTEFPLTV